QTTTENQHLIYLIFHADPLVQLTIFILLVFSVVSWAIIIAKHRQIKRDEERTESFYQVFWDAKKLDEVATRKGVRKGPAFEIFQVAQRSLEEHKTRKEPVERDIRRAFEEEIEQVEYGVPFLATTASAAPFIGLFGTVWGILNAFFKIGQSGASSLAVVGPHIAEALIATAIGLAAAIPAVIFYNVFVNKIRRFTKVLGDFTDDLIDRVEQENLGSRS
ncbi:MAG: MotA/TolQ/ExbB proton channel family protein, partial [bacterium]|nr:MotA/TolQ/ExbB proton channel family protein [bacterium]